MTISIVAAGEAPAQSSQPLEDTMPRAVSAADAVVRDMLAAQAKELAVSEAELGRAESARGSHIDSRVNSSTLLTRESLRQEAHREFQARLDFRGLHPEAGTNILLAPTSRVIDHSVGPEALQALVQRLLREGKESELRNMIEKGPGAEAVVWEAPTTPLELVSGMIRWAYLKENDKKRIRVGAELRGWVEETLRQEGVETRSKLGGISAVDSLLMKALHHKPTMVALGKIPIGVIRELPSDLRVVHDDPATQFLNELPVDENDPGHFCFCSFGEQPPLPSNFTNLEIGGRKIDIREPRHLDILVTGSSAPKGFGDMSIDRIAGLGKKANLAILSGLQHLTTEDEVTRYLTATDTLHRNGAATMLCYAEPRKEECELSALRGLSMVRAIDLFALNSFEALELLARIIKDARDQNRFRMKPELLTRCDEAVTQALKKPVQWEDGHEHPAWIAESALLLQEVLAIPIVRVRGKACDAVALSEHFDEKDAEEVHKAQIVSRDLATLKVAYPSGVIREREQVRPLRNISRGEYQAALFIAGDKVAPHAPDFGIKGYARRKDGRLISVATPIQFYVRTGGTQSAGDVGDGTFASELALTVLQKARAECH